MSTPDTHPPAATTPPTGPAPACQVRNHWWPRPGWRPGRLFYTWHLTFPTATGLHHLAERYRQALAGLPTVDPIPDQWLHLTMQGVGYVDETPDEHARAVVKAVSARLATLPTFDVTFHRAALRAEAIVLYPEPSESIAQLWTTIRAGIADVVGADEVTTGPEQAAGFTPHVSVGYFNQDGPAAPYAERLASVDVGPTTVTITEAALIVQHRVLDPEWLYRWTTYDSAPLSTLAKPTQ